MVKIIIGLFFIIIGLIVVVREFREGVKKNSMVFPNQIKIILGGVTFTLLGLYLLINGLV